MTDLLNYDIEVSKFEHQSPNCIHFQTNAAHEYIYVARPRIYIYIYICMCVRVCISDCLSR